MLIFKETTQMKLLAITKSDFKGTYLSKKEVYSLVMAFAEFNFDEDVTINVENTFGEATKNKLIKSMIEWVESYKNDFEIDCICSDHYSEMFTSYVTKMLNKEYSWMKNSAEVICA
jgi:hypothetical protein